MKVSIVLSGGKGLRTGLDIPKQYIMMDGKPLLYHTLKAFEESVTDVVVIVCALEYVDYVKSEIVEKYKLTKVKGIVVGGAERYDSVNKALSYIKENIKEASYIAIHDGARPFVTTEVIAKAFEKAVEYGAAVAGVPSKDTVKIVDDKGIIRNTPNRKDVYIIQTPQVFRSDIIYEAFGEWEKTGDRDITDDAMMVERYTLNPVVVSEGDYENIKVTTASDIKKIL